MSILPIFSKELFNPSIFSREEVLRIRSKKMITAIAGNKVIVEKLLETKNKYKIKKRTERTITAPLKTAIMEKECIKRLNKFI